MYDLISSGLCNTVLLMLHDILSFAYNTTCLSLPLSVDAEMVCNFLIIQNMPHTHTQPYILTFINRSFLRWGRLLTIGLLMKHMLILHFNHSHQIVFPSHSPVSSQDYVLKSHCNPLNIYVPAPTFFQDLPFFFLNRIPWEWLGLLLYI